MHGRPNGRIFAAELETTLYNHLSRARRLFRERREMKNQVAKGLSQQAIVEEARKHGAKWVIVFHDHYRGNSPGYYQTLESFARSEHFGWHSWPDDRKATSVFYTDEDVPTMVSERSEIVSKLRQAQFDADKAVRDVCARHGGRKWIDGRWSITNPKYIEATNFNKKLARAENRAAKPFREEAERCRAILSEESFISSGLIEIDF